MQVELKNFNLGGIIERARLLTVVHLAEAVGAEDGEGCG
jgi:hypothetical protein